MQSWKEEAMQKQNDSSEKSSPCGKYQLEKADDFPSEKELNTGY